MIVSPATHVLIDTLPSSITVLVEVITLCSPLSSQDPAGIFELVEVVGNGTYGQVYKVRRGTNMQPSNQWSLFRVTEEVGPGSGSLREAIGDDRGWEPLEEERTDHRESSNRKKKGDIISECRHAPGCGRNQGAANGCGIGSRKSAWGRGCEGAPGNSQFVPEVWVDTFQDHKEAWG